MKRAGLTMKDCVNYVWSLPVSTIIVGCDTVAQLEENVALARAFKPLEKAEMAAIEARTKKEALQCSWYKRDSVEPWACHEPYDGSRAASPERRA
jgi:hypothetical protein